MKRLFQTRTFLFIAIMALPAAVSFAYGCTRELTQQDTADTCCEQKVRVIEKGELFWESLSRQFVTSVFSK